MKTAVCSFILLSLFSSGWGQNLQVHYDWGHGRHYVTSTLEMYRPDDWGWTYWFVDMDYNTPEHAMSLAYWEISRYFNIPHLPGWSWTLQYNDGVDLSYGNLGQVWLAGINYQIHLGSWIFPTEVLARKVAGAKGLQWQLTTVWFQRFLQERVELSGFADFWRDPASGGGRLIFISEPQFWYRLTKQLWLGGEVEISHNFVSEHWEFMPTTAFRWEF